MLTATPLEDFPYSTPRVCRVIKEKTKIQLLTKLGRRCLLGDSSLVNSSDTAPVYCMIFILEYCFNGNSHLTIVDITVTKSDTSLMVHVNTTTASSSSNVTLSNQMLFIPDSGSSSTNIGFISSSNATSKTTSGFIFYGNYRCVLFLF